MATGTATTTACSSFLVNKDLVPNVPADWADLLKDEYANSVALAGDPRASNQAIQGVYAAGLSKGAAAGEAAGTAGLEFFKELNAKGNFVPVIGKAATLAQGQTPILVTWDYNALAGRDTLNGNPPVDVVVPEDRRRRRRLRAGDQRLRAASERREAVDGVPLLGRRSARLAEGLLPPDPLQRSRQEGRDPAGDAGQAAAGSGL